nr:TPA_asm: integrase [Orchesella springtail adintovirus]
MMTFMKKASIYTIGTMEYTSEDFVDLENPTAFTSVHKIVKTLGHSVNKVKQQVLKQNAYRLHHPAPRKFERRRIFSPYTDANWGLDLAEIRKFSSSNYNKNYILVCIDFFSKHAWFRPLKTKSAKEVLAAFRDILDSSERKPERLTSDYGKEFINSKFKGYCKENNILQYFTNSPIKTSIAERLIRTLFQMISKYMTHHKTKRFIQKLKSFEFIYNNSYHRSIKRAPSTVSKENHGEVFEALYGNVPKKQKPTLHVGDTVLRVLDKPIFTKGYTQNFESSPYTVTKVRDTNPPTYEIEGEDGKIARAYYRKELLKY